MAENTGPPPSYAEAMGLEKDTGRPAASDSPLAECSSTINIHEEGNLKRKHELEAGGKKACIREWEKVYVVLDGAALSCYKDDRHAKMDPTSHIHHESAIDLAGAVCEIPSNYGKRPHVFRLRLPSGAEYLFAAQDQKEMEHWMDRISSTTGIR